MTGKSSYRVLPREAMYMENDLLPTNASNFQIRSNFTKEVVLVKEKKRFIHLFSPTVPSSYLTPKLQLQSQLQKDTQVHSFKEIPFLKGETEHFPAGVHIQAPTEGGWGRASDLLEQTMVSCYVLCRST